MQSGIVKTVPALFFVSDEQPTVGSTCNAQYSFAAAVGFANSFINSVILLTAKKTTDTNIF